MKTLEISRLSMQYTYGAKAVTDFFLSLDKGEAISILGGEQSGKSSLFSCIAGFFPASEGSILINGKNITGAKIKDRDVMLIPSDGGFFMRKSLLYNLMYPLRIRKIEKSVAEATIIEILKLVGLDKAADEQIFRLSDKERALAAFLRSLVREASVYLFDDILKKLNASDRQEVFLKILPLIKGLSGAVVFATTQPDEAFSISDEVIVLNYGCTVDVGSRCSILNSPKSLISYKYCSDIDINIVSTMLTENDGETILRLLGDEFAVKKEHLLNEIYSGNEVVCAFRVGLADSGIDISSCKRYVAYKNGSPFLYVEVFGITVCVDILGREESAVDYLMLVPESIKLFDKVSERPIYFYTF